MAEHQRLQRQPVPELLHHSRCVGSLVRGSGWGDPVCDGCLVCTAGMWPSNKDGSDPSYCGAKFNSDAIKSLETVMDKEWPSYQGENDSFWSHEFEKHGSCACNLPVRCPHR